jgi:hypothetical protein
VKRKYDPMNVFYILKGVGSQEWSVDNGGRMCRAGPGKKPRGPM